jgi:hypothetical protein
LAYDKIMCFIELWPTLCKSYDAIWKKGGKQISVSM